MNAVKNRCVSFLYFETLYALILSLLDSFSRIAGGVHSVAEALLLLLESTAEPLIPYNLHNVCLSAATNYLQCKQVNRIKEVDFIMPRSEMIHDKLMSYLSLSDPAIKLDNVWLSTVTGRCFK
jgi:phosphatidylinositol-bisphosphatase